MHAISKQKEDNMTISVDGIGYSYLSPDAAHICKDAMQTPFDGCMTTFAEVRCITYGAPELSTGYSQVAISWSNNGTELGRWYGFSQGLKSAPADPDRYNEYTVTCMDAMAYLNNIPCRYGGVFSISSFAAYVYQATGITVRIENDAVFSTKHLMPEDSDDSSFPTYGSILQDLGKALGIVFCADTTKRNWITYASANEVGGALTPYFPGTKLSVNEPYSSIVGKWNFDTKFFPSFPDLASETMTGSKVNYSEGVWHKYKDKYVTRYYGMQSENWETDGSGSYIGKISYCDSIDDLGRPNTPTESSEYIAGFAIQSTQLSVFGSFTVTAEVFINPEYHSDDENKNVPLLWKQSRPEATGDKCAIFILDGNDRVFNPYTSVPARLPDSGWVRVSYSFDLRGATITQLSYLRLCINSRYLIEGDDNSDGSGGRGWTFVRNIQIQNVGMKNGITIKKEGGEMGKSFNINTPFVATDINTYLPGMIMGAGISTDSVMSMMASRLCNKTTEMTAVLSSTNYPGPSSGIKSFDFDVAHAKLTQTNYTS